MKSASPIARILLVEDDPSTRTALRECLEDAGLEVDVAVDGAEVMPQVRRSRPDVVVMDLVLPGINGFDAARLLRSDPEMAEIPLIAVTASWLDSKPEWLLEVGFDGVLRKPFTPYELLVEIHRLMNPPTEPERYLESYRFTIASDPDPLIDGMTG